MFKDSIFKLIVTITVRAGYRLTVDSLSRYTSLNKIHNGILDTHNKTILIKQPYGVYLASSYFKIEILKHSNRTYNLWTYTISTFKPVAIHVAKW